MSRDINGNKNVKIIIPGECGFSIQTNGNLPITHREHEPDIPEIHKYIKEYGTKQQKTIFFNLENRKIKEKITDVKLVAIEIRLDRIISDLQAEHTKRKDMEHMTEQDAAATEIVKFLSILQYIKDGKIDD